MLLAGPCHFSGIDMSCLELKECGTSFLVVLNSDLTCSRSANTSKLALCSVSWTMYSRPKCIGRQSVPGQSHCAASLKCSPFAALSKTWSFRQVWIFVLSRSWLQWSWKLGISILCLGLIARPCLHEQPTEDWKLVAVCLSDPCSNLKLAVACK